MSRIKTVLFVGSFLGLLCFLMMANGRLSKHMESLQNQEHQSMKTHPAPVVAMPFKSADVVSSSFSPSPQDSTASIDQRKDPAHPNVAQPPEDKQIIYEIPLDEPVLVQ